MLVSSFHVIIIITFTHQPSEIMQPGSCYTIDALDHRAGQSLAAEYVEIPARARGVRAVLSEQAQRCESAKNQNQASFRCLPDSRDKAANAVVSGALEWLP